MLDSQKQDRGSTAGASAGRGEPLGHSLYSSSEFRDAANRTKMAGRKVGNIISEGAMQHHWVMERPRFYSMSFHGNWMVWSSKGNIQV